MRQTFAVTILNLRNLPQRWGSSFVIVIGITGVVAVLLTVSAVASGFRRTIDNSASEDRAIVLSRGAESEAGSGIARDAVSTIMDSPGIARARSGRPLASAELLITAPIARKSDGKDAYVTLRGIGPLGLELRPEIRIVAGRMFAPAVHELIAGRAAQDRFSGLSIGDRVLLRGGEWTVVGMFESAGNSHESGLLADSETVLAAYQQQAFASVTVKLVSAGGYKVFKDALTSNPTLEVDVRREAEYIATVSKGWHRLLNMIAYTIGGIMAVGALFGALNTMYSAVSARAVEIATLRALGFSSASVVSSVFIEALLLALLGAVMGASIAYSLFNGHAISTIGGTAQGSQLIYQLAITPQAIGGAILLALLIGFMGGLLPAIRAARMPIAAALRSA
ncbi:MAG: ABC transporter permease [Povalibacter sp.]